MRISCLALYFCLVLVLFVGCGTDPNMPMEVKDIPTIEAAESLHRFKITRMGVFPDSIAYNGKRGVYVIKDTHTGKEWVGVSGIGISDLGSHSDGEDIHTDER